MRGTKKDEKGRLKGRPWVERWRGDSEKLSGRRAERERHDGGREDRQGFFLVIACLFVQLSGRTSSRVASS